jgi:hypothetical protein
MARRHSLRDDQWKRIRNLLPAREGTVGVTAKDNRLFVEGGCCTGIARACLGAICPSASAIFASRACASAAGPKPAFGPEFSSIWR